MLLPLDLVTFNLEACLPMGEGGESNKCLKMIVQNKSLGPGEMT